MKRSYIADSIMTEYNREQYYKKKLERQNCKETECDKCRYQYICDNKEVEDNIEKGE